MGSKIKEDERTEKAIRSLLKLPENRRCINCNSLGPQYVCSTFWTFVCINCSGIHREFTHRVKSISMAKFTAEEVSALRAGGNERARQVYFKEWDSQRDAYPDASNIFKLRDFIRSVYVDKRYSSGSNDKISQQKLAVAEDYRESKKATANSLGSRSFHSVNKLETERASAGGKSLKFYFEDMEHKQQHVTHNPKSRGLPKSPIRFEIVDDRYRDDGSVKRYDARRESRGSSKSLDLSSNKEPSSLPIVRHASELIGENHPHLRVEKVVTVEKKKDPVKNQLAASSKTMESPGSLMDDVPVSEPSDDSISQTSNELHVSQKAIEGPAPNSLEALLFGFSVPSEDNHPAANLETQAVPRTEDNVTTSFVTSPTVSQAGSLELAIPAAAADNFNTNDMVTTSAAESNQVESSTLPKEPSDTSMEQSTLCISNYAHGDHQEETKSSVRSALPEDLFTGGFSFASPQVHAQHHGMGYGMQYYQYPVATGAYTYTSKPSNPFDLSYYDDTCSNQTPQYPSMAYTQGGALPLVPVPRGVSDSSGMAADSIGLMMASQSPFYAPALSPTSPSLASNLSSGAYAGQQPHVNMPQSFRRQEMNSMGNAETTYNAAHSYHQANINGYPSANRTNAYISRGNPFD